MLDKFKEFVALLNSKGIPLPMVRDPKTGIASVSLTLVVISSIFVEVGLIGKYAKMFEGIDVSQALNFFMASAALYFSRNLSNNNGKLESKTSEEKENNNAQ